ncbi:unnamed protein product [Blepharisma stoltei]|uniref:Uncharacterized protein n=1 Tax=Blepharisma stoltei TaxID=1481888 RepID=A0AAU9JAF5_9CILI|nr:unnamed protein product [Blepharisma stoltei]
METLRAFNENLLIKLPQDLQEFFKSLPLSEYSALVTLFIFIFIVCLVSVILGDPSRGKKVDIEDLYEEEPRGEDQEEAKKKVPAKPSSVQKKPKKEALKKKTEIKQSEIKEKKAASALPEAENEDWVVVENKKAKKKTE